LIGRFGNLPTAGTEVRVELSGRQTFVAAATVARVISMMKVFAAATFDNLDERHD
jgi:hypothetical protein